MTEVGVRCSLWTVVEFYCRRENPFSCFVLLSLQDTFLYFIWQRTNRFHLTHVYQCRTWADLQPVPSHAYGYSSAPDLYWENKCSFLDRGASYNIVRGFLQPFKALKYVTSCTSPSLPIHSEWTPFHFINAMLTSAVHTVLLNNLKINWRISQNCILLNGVRMIWC
jgi:hypothetical protein